VAGCLWKIYNETHRYKEKKERVLERKWRDCQRKEEVREYYTKGKLKFFVAFISTFHL
jgi:hypothetical protein